MPGVFLSYDRQDEAKARNIAQALERAGHFVWWDLHIKGGAEYGKVIEQALADADAVVVLWSRESVDSPWVRDEAAAGRDKGHLIPILLEPVNPPMGFRQYQNLDFSKWKGRGKPPQFAELQSAIESFGGSSKAGDVSVEPLESSRKPRLTRSRLALIVIAVAASLVIATLALWQPWRGRSGAPVVAIAAASQSETANAMARDLLAKLGNLNATQVNAVKLVEGREGGSNADLLFKVDGKTEGQTATANLLLLGGQDRSLLWSKDFEQPVAHKGDLNQQLAYTAAKVLECAMEALTGDGRGMRQDTLKLYLNGCSAYSEIAAFDPRLLVPMFQTVVAQAPKFEGGWNKLLHVESEIASNQDDPTTSARMTIPLRAHMAEARKLNPDMAALLLAEADLLPPTAYRQASLLLERAVDKNPDSPEALIAHGTFLSTVGRHNDAIERAQRAVQLDPLSPLSRDALISALTYGGQFDLAEEELRKAERLWPGASNLLAARYRLHLRYGDPQEAIRIQKLGHYGGPHRDAFLRARIDPTPANVEKAIAYPRRWFRQYPEAIVELSQVLGAFGREEELFPILLSWRRLDKAEWITEVLFRPALKNVHHDPRMMAVADRLGLLGFWRESNQWPDFCMHPDLPYDCKAEAAKFKN